MMTVLSCLSVVLLFYVVYVSTENVPAPKNIRVISKDLGLVLEWDPPQSTANELFNYTAEMKGWSDYETVCPSSSSLSCDFTGKVTIFGTYELRVRTESHGETSDWVETEMLAVDSITEISAPYVELRSSKGKTEVEITDPPMKTKTKALRDVFGNINYRIHFWKKGEAKKEELKREQNRVMLPNLEPLVNYCVEVEIVYFKNKTSEPSNVTCLTNTSSNEAEPWLIAVVLLVSFLVVLVTVVLIFLAVWYGYKICKNIFPDAKLPEHLKQYLVQPYQSPVLWAMQKEDFYELRICDADSSQDNQQTERSVTLLTNTDECDEQT